MENFCDVILMTYFGDVIFMTSYELNYATSDHWDTKRFKIIRYFIFSLNFDLAKGVASALLAHLLVAPLAL